MPKRWRLFRSSSNNTQGYWQQTGTTIQSSNNCREGMHQKLARLGDFLRILLGFNRWQFYVLIDKGNTKLLEAKDRIAIATSAL
jgi:hypothetical protein